MERKADENEMLTVTVATAVSISFSADSLKKWQAAHPQPRSRASVEAQNGTIGRLAAMFPGAVRIH